MQGLKTGMQLRLRRRKIKVQSPSLFCIARCDWGWINVFGVINVNFCIIFHMFAKILSQLPRVGCCCCIPLRLFIASRQPVCTKRTCGCGFFLNSSWSCLISPIAQLVIWLPPIAIGGIPLLGLTHPIDLCHLFEVPFTCEYRFKIRGRAKSDAKILHFCSLTQTTEQNNVNRKH